MSARSSHSTNKRDSREETESVIRRNEALVGDSHNNLMSTTGADETRRNNHLHRLDRSCCCCSFLSFLRTDTSSLDDNEVFSSSRRAAQWMRRRRWTLTLYALTTVLLYADQNLMSPNLTQMAEEFNFTDLQRDQKLGGDIALAFWMTGVPATLLFGCLADRCNRSVLFALTVGIGEGACFVTYFTSTYWQLYACRAVTGFSMGGALPVIYSVMGDLFQANERHGVSAMVAMGSGLGISLGQGIAGFLGPTYGWRVPFLVVSAPALLLALLVLLTIQDPKRGGTERVVLNSSNDKRYHRQNDNNTEWSSLPQGEEDEGDAVELTSMPPFRDNVHDTKGDQTQQARTDGMDGLYDQQLNDDSYRVYRDLNYESEHRVGNNKASEGQENRSSALQTFCSLLSSPTVLLCLWQGAPGCIPWGTVNTVSFNESQLVAYYLVGRVLSFVSFGIWNRQKYLNDFLSDDRGMTVEFATFTLLWFGFGTFLGMVLGGAGGNYLYSVDPRYPTLLAGSSAIFGCFPFWVLLNFIYSNSSFFAVVTTTLLAGIGCGVTGPIVKATLQNVTLPTSRGQAFALANVFDDFGRGLGPVFVAMLIKVTGGRTAAFNIGVFGWVLCGVLNLAMFFTVTTDEQKVQSALLAEMIKRNESVEWSATRDTLASFEGTDTAIGTDNLSPSS